MDTLSFRPRPVDIHKAMPLLKDDIELSDGSGSIYVRQIPDIKASPPPSLRSC